MTVRLKWIIGFAALAALAGGSWWLWTKQPTWRDPLVAHALRGMDSANAHPVTERELAGNALRRAAGLREINPHWFIAPTKHFVCDGPEFHVVLDEQRQAVSVISHFTGSLVPVRPVWTEYEVRNGALNGLAATWWGNPPRLYETAAYRQNRRDGSTVCFDTNGVEVARCEYRKDEPWTGRMLQRTGFGRGNKEDGPKAGLL